MVLLLDLARLLLGTALLAFASFTDWRWRRAPNVLWWIMSGAAALFLLVEGFLDPAPALGKWPYLLSLPVILVLVSESTLLDVTGAALGIAGAVGSWLHARAAPDVVTAQWPYLAGIVIFAALIYAFWYFGLIAGGADAKALMALAILVPFPLALGGVPVWSDQLPGSFATLGDSLIAFLVIPIALAIWNLAHGHARFPHLFLGVKRPATSARAGHAWPMETVDEHGARKTRLFASRMSPGEVDETFDRLAQLGDEKVWVTPKVPYMIPLLLGFVAAFTLGDLLYAGISRVMGH